MDSCHLDVGDFTSFLVFVTILVNDLCVIRATFHRVYSNIETGFNIRYNYGIVTL